MLEFWGFVDTEILKEQDIEIPKELQALFCLSARDHKKAKDVLYGSKSFVDWARKNQYLF